MAQGFGGASLFSGFDFDAGVQEDAADAGGVVSQGAEVFGELAVYFDFDLTVGGVLGLADGARVEAGGEFFSAEAALALEVGSVFGAAAHAILGPGGGAGGVAELFAGFLDATKQIAGGGGEVLGRGDGLAVTAAGGFLEGFYQYVCIRYNQIGHWGLLVW
jgi:hypothetical protein